MNGRISWFGSIHAIGRSRRRLVDLQSRPVTPFYHWAVRDFAAITAVKAFTGAMLLVGWWIVCIRTAFVALGALGLVLSALVLGTLVWMLQDYGISTLIIRLCFPGLR